MLSVLADAEKVAEYEADGFTVFEDPTRAVVAIDAMHQYGAAFARRVQQDRASFGEAVRRTGARAE